MKFNKKSLVDFNNEHREIYFRHAELLGVDGVVSNVPIFKKSLPPHCETYYIKPHAEDKDLLNVLKKGDRSYGSELEEITMFITYQKIDFGGDNRRSAEICSDDFYIYRNIMYRYELGEWIEDMRECRRSYLRSRSIEIRKKKKVEEKEKERLKGVLNEAKINVNNICLEVLYANRIIIGDFYKEGYKYYICSQEKGDWARPDRVTDVSTMDDVTMFGTIISPVPIFMDGKRLVKLHSISIDFKSEVNVENATDWIRKYIREYDIHERIVIINRIEEAVTNLLIKSDFDPEKDSCEEFIKNNSYEVAKAIKNGFDGRGAIGKIGDDYVWTNIVTGRSYDYKGRREGKVKYGIPEE